MAASRPGAPREAQVPTTRHGYHPTAGERLIAHVRCPGRTAAPPTRSIPMNEEPIASRRADQWCRRWPGCETVIHGIKVGGTGHLPSAPDSAYEQEKREARVCARCSLLPVLSRGLAWV